MKSLQRDGPPTQRFRQFIVFDLHHKSMKLLSPLSYFSKQIVEVPKG